MLSVISEEEMDYIDEFQAAYQGKLFTGYAVEFGSGFINYKTYIHGMAKGSEYASAPDGALNSFSHAAVNQLALGGMYDWGEGGGCWRR